MIYTVRMLFELHAQYSPSIKSTIESTIRKLQELPDLLQQLNEITSRFGSTRMRAVGTAIMS